MRVTLRSGTKVAQKLELRADFGPEFRCTVGRGSKTDLQLPVTMMDIGRQEFSVVGSDGKLQLHHNNPWNRFLVDGKVFESGEISVGEHVLEINEHQLLLVLLPDGGGSQ
jgi:hypothetical protein